MIIKDWERILNFSEHQNQMHLIWKSQRLDDCLSKDARNIQPRSAIDTLHAPASYWLFLYVLIKLGTNSKQAVISTACLIVKLHNTYNLRTVHKI
jgi:hypothetical protein